MGAGKRHGFGTTAVVLSLPELLSGATFRTLSGKALQLEHREGPVEGRRRRAVAQAVRELVAREQDWRSGVGITAQMARKPNPFTGGPRGRTSQWGHVRLNRERPFQGCVVPTGERSREGFTM